MPGTIAALVQLREAFWRDYNAPDRGAEAQFARKALDLAVAEMVMTWEDDPMYLAHGVDAASHLLLPAPDRHATREGEGV